jgi:hypothetical protein
MTNYFYDAEKGKLIVYDDAAGTVREIDRITLGFVPPPAMVERTTTGAAVEKRKYTKRGPATAQAREWNGGVSPGRSADGKSKRQRRNPCSECGSIGARHFKTCSLGSGVKATPLVHTKSSLPAISQMTFGRIKISQSHDVPAEQIARNLDVPVAEVEKAFTVETYSDYQKW